MIPETTHGQDLSNPIQADTELLVHALVDFMRERGLDPDHPAVAMAALSIAATSVFNGLQRGFYLDEKTKVLEGYRQLASDIFTEKAQEDLGNFGTVAAN